ncbi:MAG: N-6 DNA methylase [Alphaproteobacteria bacterium]|nr:N-6 DNA methylase [Alphaproteobacteria bacterium]
MAVKRAESRTRSFIREQAAQRGWDLRHPARGGDVLEEQECVDHLPDLGLGLERPDFIFCLRGRPVVVVEAKNKARKIPQAVQEAQGYADTIRAAGKHRPPIAVGVAGEPDAGFRFRTRFFTAEGWTDLVSHGHAITGFPSPREVELALQAQDGSTTVAIPSAAEFISAALEVSDLLRLAKVEAPLRPRVLGALILAMVEGTLDPDKPLASVNQLVRDALKATPGLSKSHLSRLTDALFLTGADFNRLEPHLGRIEATLERLNVRSVIASDADFLGLFYEAFLRYGYDNNALGIVFTPRHITRLCCDLIDVGPKDRVIDVACGTGGFLVAAFDRMKARARSDAVLEKVRRSLAGFDTNPTVWALANLNMLFRGDGKSRIQQGSCFDVGRRRTVKGGFSKALLNPPFSQKGEPERDFIDASMDALEPEGLLAVVVKAGVFADGEHAGWRAEFLRRHTVEAVISLPEDLFYPTAAPTSILIARAWVPQPEDHTVLMARIDNDGFEKLKNRRVERPGSQLPDILEARRLWQAGAPVDHPAAATVPGRALRQADAEWSPQAWLPQAPVDAETRASLERSAMDGLFQATLAYPDLSASVLEDFGAAWARKPRLPLDRHGPLSDFFVIKNGRSAGERNYADGGVPYVSSGDTHNSIVRMIDVTDAETFDDGGLIVTAFGQACVQPWPFAARGNGGSAVRVLIPRYRMSFRELAWFVVQINAQRWRFFYARMAIKSRITLLEVRSPPAPLPDVGMTIAARIRAFRAQVDTFSTLG